MLYQGHPKVKVEILFFFLWVCDSEEYEDY